MGEVGIKFDFKSFSQFNKTLRDFKTIASDVDTKLLKIGTSLEKINIPKANVEGVKLLGGAFKSLSGVDSKNILTFIDMMQTFYETVAIFDSGITTAARELGSSVKNLTDALKTMGKGIDAAVVEQNLQTLKKVFDFFAGMNTQKLHPLEVGSIKDLEGLITTLTKTFNSVDLQSFSRFSGGVSKLVDTINQMGMMNAAELGPKVESFGKVIRKLTEVFSEKEGGRFFSRGKDSILNKLSQFGSVNITGFKDVVNSINDLVRTIALIENISIDTDGIKSFGKVLTEFVKIFTDQKTMKIFGKEGIFAKLGKFDSGSIQSIVLLSSAMEKITLGLSRAVIHKVDVNRVKEIGAVMTAFIGIFTQKSGGIMGFFKKDSIIAQVGKFDPKIVQNFVVTINAIAKASNSLVRLQGIQLNAKAFKDFSVIGKDIGRFINEIAKASKGKDVETIGKFLESFAKVMQQITKSKISPAINKPFDDLAKTVGKSGEKAGKEYGAGAKKTLGISSPSRVFQDIGRNIVRGLENGLRTLVNIPKLFANFVTGSLRHLANFATRAVGYVRNVVSFLGRITFKRLGDSVKSETERSSGFFGRFKENVVATLGDITRALQRFSRTMYSFALGTAVDFEWAFSGVIKTLDTSAYRLAGGQEAVDSFIGTLYEGLSELATSPTSLISGLENSFVSIANIGMAAGQLGIAGENILSFAETVGMMTLATDLEEQSAAFLLARIGAIYNTTEYDKMASSLVNLGNNFAVTESMMAPFMERVIFDAERVGLSIEEMMAIVATVGSRGIAAEAGGTAFAQLMNGIVLAVAEGGEKLTSFANVSDMTAEQFAETWRTSPMEAIQAFASGFEGLGSEAALAWEQELGVTGIRLRRFFGALVGDGGETLQRALDVVSEGWKEAGDSVENYNAIQREAHLRSQTARAAINRLRNVIKGLSDTFGRYLLPAYGEGLNKLSAFISKVDDWLKISDVGNAVVKLMTTAFAGLVGVIFTAAGGFNALAFVLRSPMTFAMYLLRTAAMRLIFVLTSPLAVAGSLFGLLATGGALLVGGFLVSNIFREIRENGELLNTQLVRLWSSISNIIKGFMDIFVYGARMIGIFINFGDNFSSLNILETLLTGAANAAEALENRVRRGVEAIQELYQVTAEAMGLLFPSTEIPALGGHTGASMGNDYDAIVRGATARPGGSLITAPLSIEYRFQRGDELWKVAQDHGVTWQELLDFNEMTLNDVMSASTIQIPITRYEQAAQTNGESIGGHFASGLVSGIEEVSAESINNPIINSLFSDDQEMSLFSASMVANAERFSKAVETIGKGFSELFRGNPVNFFNTVKTGFYEIGASIFNTFDTIVGIKTESGSPIRDYIESALGGDFNKIATYIEENLPNFITLGLGLAFRTPLSLTISLSNFILNSLKFWVDDSTLENHPFLAALIEFRDAIADFITNIFMELFGPGESTPSSAGKVRGGVRKMSAANFLGKNLTISTDDSSFLRIVNALGKLILIVVESAFEFGGLLVESAYNKVIKPLFTSIHDAFKNAHESGSLSDTSSKIGAVLGDFLVNLFTKENLNILWSDVIRPIFQSIADAIIGEQGWAEATLGQKFDAILKGALGLAVISLVVSGTFRTFAAMFWARIGSALLLPGAAIGLGSLSAVMIADMLFGDDTKRFEIGRIIWEDIFGVESYQGLIDNVGAYLEETISKALAQIALTTADIFDREPFKTLFGTGGTRDAAETRVRALDLYYDPESFAAAMSNTQFLLNETDIVEFLYDSGKLKQEFIDSINESLGQISDEELFESAFPRRVMSQENLGRIVGLEIEQGKKNQFFEILAGPIREIGDNQLQNLFKELANRNLDANEFGVEIADFLGNSLRTAIETEDYYNIWNFQQMLETFFENGELSLETVSLGVTAMQQVAAALKTEAETQGYDIGEILGEEFDSGFKSMLGIQSPSTVFKQHGDNIILGVVAGLEGSLPMIEESFNKITLYWHGVVNDFVFNTGRMIDALNNLATTAAQVQNGGGGPEVILTPQNRMYGGPIQKNKTYEILEHGLPFELFNTGGRTFMLANANGYMQSPLNTPTVSNNNNYNSSGGNMTVNVSVGSINGDVNDARVQEIGNQLSDLVSKQINQNYSVSQKLKNRGVL